MRMYKGQWGKPYRYTQCIKTHILHYKSHEILYQVLQVTQNQYPSQYLHTTWESVSGTTVTWIPSEHAMRFEVHYHHYSIKLSVCLSSVAFSCIGWQLYTIMKGCSGPLYKQLVIQSWSVPSSKPRLYGECRCNFRGIHSLIWNDST